MDANWTPTAQRLPDKGQRVEWISPGGIHSRGTFAGGLIWMPDNSPSYGYYQPAYWRPQEQADE